MSLVINDMAHSTGKDELKVLLEKRFSSSVLGSIIKVTWTGAEPKTRFYMHTITGSYMELVDLETGVMLPIRNAVRRFEAYFTTASGELRIDDLAIVRDSELVILGYHND